MCIVVARLTIDCQVSALAAAVTALAFQDAVPAL